MSFITIIYIVRRSRFVIVFELVVVLFFLFIIGYISISIFVQASLNLDSKLKFLNEVIVNKPSLDMNAWESVCQHINSFMYTNHYWPTPYYFFDGKSCYCVFQNMVLKKCLPTFAASKVCDSYYYEDRKVLRYMKKCMMKVWDNISTQRIS
ncbi:hypothetical protein MOUN0_O13410 [Monosporozyma unispora]